MDESKKNESNIEQPSSKIKKFNNFMTEGVRLRNDILTLENRAGRTLFKSIGKTTYYMEKMGQRRWDGHFFNIEEALFLTELGAALIVDQYRNPLNIQQIYGLLGQFGISSLKYTIFAQLSRNGYIVRRPMDYSSNGENNFSSDYPQKISFFNYPKELLDQFPSMQSIKINNYFVLQMHLPPIQGSNNFTKLFTNDESCNQIELAELNGRFKEIVQQSLSNHLSRVRRWNRDPWEQYRPRHWPIFNSLRSSENWRFYASKREELLRNARGKQQRQIRQTKSKDQPNYDYLLFGESGNNASPLYRLLVVDDRFQNGHPNFAELQRLASQTENALPPLLVATGVPNCFKINQFQMENEQTLSPI